MNYNLKNKIYLIIAVFAVIFTSTSCEDIFEQKAGNKITPELHYQTKIDLEISMIGVLSPLQQGMPKLIIMDGLLSDMMNETSNIDVNMQAINEHVLDAGNPYLNTSDFYKVIINANEVLNHVDDITLHDPTFDEFYIKQYKNALIGMRSWAYFTLAKLHGEVAYIPDNMAKIPDTKLTYIKKDAIMDTLISQMLPYLHLDKELDELYFELYVNTKALIGEIYLEKNDYANAATYLKLAMESYGNGTITYKVDRTFTKDSWKLIFANADGNLDENISVVPFKSTDGQVNPVTKWCLYNDEYLVKPSNVIVDLFNSQKPLKGDNGDVFRGLGISFDTINGEYFINKYSIDENEPYGSDIIISRAADIHLLLAEALNRMGDHTNALILLNNGFNSASKVPTEYRLWNKGLGIRGRAYLANRTVPDDVANKTEFIEDLIIEERAMELAFEGKRYFDLMRIARRRGNTDYLASRVAKKFSDPNHASEIKHYLWGEETWYIPIAK